MKIPGVHNENTTFEFFCEVMKLVNAEKHTVFRPHFPQRHNADSLLVHIAATDEESEIIDSLETLDAWQIKATEKHVTWFELSQESWDIAQKLLSLSNSYNPANELHPCFEQELNHVVETSNRSLIECLTYSNWKISSDYGKAPYMYAWVQHRPSRSGGYRSIDRLWMSRDTQQLMKVIYNNPDNHDIKGRLEKIHTKCLKLVLQQLGLGEDAKPIPEEQVQEQTGGRRSRRNAAEAAV